MDTLALRKQLHVLNDVLTNPRVTKVMHGADSDVLWLQRDLGLYLVGVFDTGQAARRLVSRARPAGEHAGRAGRPRRGHRARAEAAAA